MFQLRIGFMASLGFEEMPADEVVDMLAGLGYDAVSWPLSRFHPLNTSRTERNETVKTCKSAGLSISEFILQQDFIHTDRITRRSRVNFCIQTLNCLADLNIRAPVNIFSGPAPWDAGAPRLGKDVSEGEAWEMLFDALDELVPVAERLSIPLAMEGVFGHLVHDYYTTQELFRRYHSEVLGVNFDPSHGLLVGNDIPWAVEQLGATIFHVHLKDVVGKPGMPDENFSFPLLGEGVVPWKPFFNALEKIKYGWFCTVEFEAFRYYQNVLKNNPVQAALTSFTNVQALLH